MRDIKFRGKQKSWIYGGLSIFNNEATIFDENCIANSAYEVDINSVGQYTGFNDFDGKEIYEGDILEYVHFRRDENKRREIVVFSQICGGWYVRKQADSLTTILFEQHNEEWQLKQNYKPSPKHKVRVIGNIYENPELLNQ